jgi:hypothetical protein
LALGGLGHDDRNLTDYPVPTIAWFVASFVLVVLIRAALRPAVIPGAVVTTASGQQVHILKSQVVPLFGNYLEVTYLADGLSEEQISALAHVLFEHFRGEAEHGRLERVHIDAEVATSRGRFVTHSEVISQAFVLNSDGRWNSALSA